MLCNFLAIYSMSHLVLSSRFTCFIKIFQLLDFILVQRYKVCSGYKYGALLQSLDGWPLYKVLDISQAL